MIFDTLDNLEIYVALNPLFAHVVDFLRTHRLAELPTGTTKIVGDDVFVNIQDCEPKTRTETLMETHRVMTDIQIPISDAEEHGFSPRESLAPTEYDAERDVEFYNVKAQNYIQLRPGQFVIYFPTDGHSPAITGKPLRKAIFKVKTYTR